MKRSATVLSILLITVVGCSKGDGKSGNGSAEDTAQSSPKTVVEAMFAECQKDKPDKDAILKLMSKEMQDQVSEKESFDGLIKYMKGTKLTNVENVTTHDSGNYANVHVALTVKGKDKKEKIPTIKVGEKWYVHTRYGEKTRKTGESKSQSDREGKTYSEPRSTNPDEALSKTKQ